MKIYLVGGAVRDELLGLPVAERDWVVVGATADEMLTRGFVAADRDFPVYLHPESGEEYALARRETKTGEGYRGFSVYAGPDVTLEEDLRRRDLTVNAMARGADGIIVDPFDGREDLDAGLLRHVSPAFVEDPLRVLRIARFAAKLGRHGFHVAHATHRLLVEMVRRGDMAQLTRERLWREMSRAMATGQPWRFFEVLHRCGALAELIPPLAVRLGEPAAHRDRPDAAPVAALKQATRVTAEPVVRLAAALYSCAATPAEADRLTAELRADRETAQLLHRVINANAQLAGAARGDVGALFDVAVQWRAFGRSTDWRSAAQVATAQPGLSELGRYLDVAVPAASRVDARPLAAQGLRGPALGAALAEARRDAMATALCEAGLVT